MRNVREAFGKLAARNHSPERKRTASQEEANTPQLDSAPKGKESKKLIDTRVDQPLMPHRGPPGVAEAVAQSKVALAVTDGGRYRNNEQFLDALQHVAAASRDADSAETLAGLRMQLETPEAEGRFARFNAGELAKYQSALRALGWNDLSLKAGQLRLQRLNSDFSDVRLDADAKVWLEAIETGHAAELPAQCRIVGELERFKQAVFTAVGTNEPAKCNWRDFVKVVCMIPGMKSAIRDQGDFSFRLWQVLNDAGAPSITARVAERLAREITAFQQMAAKSHVDGDALTMRFNFGCSVRSHLQVSGPRLTNIHIGASSPWETYRVVAGDDGMTAWLLNAQMDSPGSYKGEGDEDGSLEFPANAWQPPLVAQQAQQGK